MTGCGKCGRVLKAYINERPIKFETTTCGYCRWAAWKNGVVKVLRKLGIGGRNKNN